MNPKLLLVLTAVAALLPCGCDRRQKAGGAKGPAPVCALLGTKIETHGLTPCNAADGKDGAMDPAQMGNQECRKLRHKWQDSYAYFAVDPAFKGGGLPDATVTVEYFDATNGAFSIVYDCRDSKKGGDAYAPSKERIELRGTQKWHKAKFVLEYPRFEGRENDGADFRVQVSTDNFYIPSVTVSQD